MRTIGVAMRIQRLTPDDLGLMGGLLDLFGAAFEEPEIYGGARPSPDYLRSLLGDPGFVALAALEDGAVVDGLAAYELRKFERQRSELYIYDLAVDADHRRRGIAIAPIEKLKPIAAARGAWVIYVQADPVDAPAVARARAAGAGTRFQS